MLFYHHPFSSCGFSFVIKISKIDFCLLKPSSRNWSSRLCYGGRNSTKGRNLWPVSLGKIKEAFQQGKEENSKALGKGEKQRSHGYCIHMVGAKHAYIPLYPTVKALFTIPCYYVGYLLNIFSIFTSYIIKIPIIPFLILKYQNPIRKIHIQKSFSPSL